VIVGDDDPRRDDTARHDDTARRDDTAQRDGETVPSQEEQGGTASEEQRRREALEGLKRLRVADLVEEMLVGLVTVGYQKLGLTDQTRELRDLGDARLAIETLCAWIDVLARERGDEGLADLRSTVAAMQLSYARAVAEPGAAEAAAGETAGAESEGTGPDETAPDAAAGSGPSAD
jgi:hypothetical protein